MPDRQRNALDGAGCDGVFEDRASRTDSDRAGLAAYLDHLRTGDVKRVLGRHAADIVAPIDGLYSGHFGFRALNSPIDTTTPARHAFL